MSEDGAVGAPERLHPLFLITGLGGSLRRAGGAFAAAAYFAATGKWGLLLIMLPILLVVLIGGLFLYWRHFEYRVGTSEIRIDSGILTRTHRSIPFDRIQDVDITQPLVARFFGLARVKFETGGSAGARDDDGVLQAITLPRAEALRAQVRARRGVVPEAASDGLTAPAPPIYAMSLKRVALAGLFNFSLALLAGLFGLTQTFGDIAGFDPFSRRFWREALSVGSPLLDLILAHRIAAGLAGVVVLTIVGLATGMIRALLREHGFRLDRSGTGLRRRRGLLTLSDVTLPIKRAQAAIIGTGPLRDRFGWRDLRLQSLARDESTKGDHIVAPLADDAEVAAILAELDWRAVAPDLVWHQVSPAYAWGFTFAALLLCIPAAVQFLFMPWIGALGFAAIGGMILARWLGWRRYRYTLDGDRLLVRSGWWRRRLIILPLASVQSVDFRENMLSRRFGTASLTIGVAGGSGFARHGVAALPRETARGLRSDLLSRF